VERNDITYELMKATKGQAFITCTQLTKALGRTNSLKVKHAYLSGLEAVDGKYYLIRDVAEVLKNRCTA